MGENKETLLSYFASSWTRLPSYKFNGKVLYVSEKENCIKLYGTNDDEMVICELILCLSCGHEEADTGMVLHANNAAPDRESILVRTPDTDVISIAMQQFIAIDLYADTDIGNRKRILNVKPIPDSLPSKAVDALIGFHALTGKY